MRRALTTSELRRTKPPATNFFYDRVDQLPSYSMALAKITTSAPSSGSAMPSLCSSW
jgi:hypothetical protein